MASLRDIPMDRNGVIKGRFFLVDKKKRTMRIAGAHFVNGRTTEPISGWRLRHLVQAMGPSLELEPVGGASAPTEAAAPPEPAPAPEPTPEPATPEPPAAAGPEPVDVDLSTLEGLAKDELLALAKQLGIEVPSRARRADVIDAIRTQAPPTAAPPETDSA